jgi:hypothetical protein
MLTLTEAKTCATRQDVIDMNELLDAFEEAGAPK